MVGYKPVNGSSDPECTHVILTLDEYDELHQRIRTAINDGKRAKAEAAQAAATSAANAEKAVKKIQDEAEKYRYKENRNDWEEVYLWETVIQTPYVVDFTAEQAMTETQELFARDEQGRWMIGRLGIAGEYDGKYEDMLVDRRCATWKDYNEIFNANV